MKLYYCDKLIYEKINLELGIYYSYEQLSAMNESLKFNEILCIKIHKSATLVGMATFMHYACMQSATHLIQSLILVIQVSKFQDEFMKSSFLPKYERKIVRIHTTWQKS